MREIFKIFIYFKICYGIFKTNILLFTANLLYLPNNCQIEMNNYTTN